jgi:hypothetical protein
VRLGRPPERVAHHDRSRDHGSDAVHGAGDDTGVDHAGHDATAGDSAAHAAGYDAAGDAAATAGDVDTRDGHGAGVRLVR